MDTEHQLAEEAPSAAPNGALYERRGGEGHLTFRGDVDIFEARTAHAAAADCLGDTEAAFVTLDLTAARRLDLAAMQILAALRRDLEAAGRPLTPQIPAPLAAAMTRTGLTL